MLIKFCIQLLAPSKNTFDDGSTGSFFLFGFLLSCSFSLTLFLSLSDKKTKVTKFLICYSTILINIRSKVQNIILQSCFSLKMKKMCKKAYIKDVSCLSCFKYIQSLEIDEG